MTCEEFNEHYKDYKEDGYYGLDFDIPNVTKFLDKIFQDLIQIPGFKYSQIKLKFNMARVYTTCGVTMNFLIEEKINQIVKAYDSIEKSKKKK